MTLEYWVLQEVKENEKRCEEKDNKETGFRKIDDQLFSYCRIVLLL